MIEQSLREKKVWGHVQGIVAVPGPILVLGAGATPAIPAVASILATMGAAIPAVVANLGVTQAQVDASQVGLAVLTFYVLPDVAQFVI